MKKFLLKLTLLMALVLGGTLPSQAGWNVLQEYDWAFTAMADGTAATYSSETVRIGGTDCNKCTGVFEHLAFQGADKWWCRGTNGLYQGNGGGREIGILDLKAGDKVTIKVSVEPSIKANLTLDGKDGEVYTYTVNADGNVGLNIDRYHYIRTLKVERFEQEAGEIPADYTIKYVNEAGDEIKASTTRSGIVGQPVVITSADKDPIMADGKKYIYASDNAEGMVVAETGTVVIIKFREAATYTYSVKSSNPEKVLGSGSDFEGETVKVFYPRYMLKEDSTLTQYPATPSSTQEYSVSLTLDKNVEQVLNYNNTDLANVVFYAEAEDIMTPATGSNADIRCSMGKGGYSATDTVITTLPAGKYTMTVSTRGGGNRSYGFKFMANGDSIYQTANLMAYNQTDTSEEFILRDETAIVMAAAGSNSDMVDFLYFTKTGDRPQFPADSIALNKHSLSLLYAQTDTLTAEIFPEDCDDPYITWTTSNDAVAAVDKNGVVRATGVGQAMIFATCGAVADSCTVTVGQASQTIVWDQLYLDAKVGKTYVLNAVSTAGLPVSYQITYGTDLAELAGDTLSLVATGTLKVLATQAGDDNVTAAEPVLKTFFIAEADPFTFELADGAYMLYADGEGFLSRGAYWGTQAMISPEYGMPFKATKVDGDDVYTFATLDAGGYLFATEDNDAFVDGNNTQNIKWVIEAKSDSTFNLKNESNGNYLCVFTDEASGVKYLKPVQDETPALWSVYTGEQYAAYVQQMRDEQIAPLATALDVDADSEATLKAAVALVDVTDQITFPARAESYQPSAAAGKFVNVVEMCNVEFSVPTAGVYCIEFPAMMRSSNTSTQPAFYNADIDYTNATISTGDFTTTIDGLLAGLAPEMIEYDTYESDANKAVELDIDGPNKWVPNSQDSFQAWAQAGYYKNTLYVQAATDGATVSIKALSYMGKCQNGQWFCENAPLTKVYRMEKTTEGISAIAADSADARYFTIQGFEVANPTPGQVYIVVKAGKASKVRF